MLHVQINNIKASIKVKGPNVRRFIFELGERNARVSKKEVNFFVLRDKFVYVIFYSGHINCTKLKTIWDFIEAKLYIAKLFNAGSEFYTVETSSIDNISASGDVLKKFEHRKWLLDRKKKREVRFYSLHQLSKLLRKASYKSRYNPQRFPGLTTKINRISFTLFNTGKFIAVGANNVKKLSAAISILEKIVETWIVKEEERV